MKEEETNVESVSPPGRGKAFYVWVRVHPSTPHHLFLIDTGANVSTMPSSLYHAIPAADRPQLKQSELKIYAGNDTRIKYEGMVEHEVDIGDMSLTATFYVCDDSVTSILGMDFLTNQGASILISQKKLFIKGREVPILDNVGARMNHLVVADVRTRLKPGSRTLVTGRVVGVGDFNGRELMVEPAQTLFGMTGLVAPSVAVTPSDNRVPMEIMNVMHTEAVLRKGTIIGTLQDTVACAEWVEPDHSLIARVCRIHTDGTPSITEEKPVPTHLQDLYDRSCKGMTTREDRLFKHLLHEYQDVFAKNSMDLGRTNIVTHHIETGDEPPVKQRPRRLPQSQQEEMERQIKALAKAGTISPSTSMWGSNVLLVKKKDGTSRMCVDYRELNKKTKNVDPYMLPRIDDTIESLGDATLYCNLDLLQGYHQVELSEESRDKTAFHAPRMTPSHWQYNTMPFGIQGGPATFQRLMDRLLAGLEYRIALAYLDDIIVFGKDRMQCLERLALVLERIRQALLKLKAKKCELFKKELLYLGYIVSGDGIKCDPAKIDAIKKWERPDTTRQVRVFLGTVNYYNRFIKDFSEIARPLYKLTRKHAKFEWDTDCTFAYEKLRLRLICAPIMAYPRRNGQYILDTDASGFAIGAVLSQMQDDGDGTPVERVIAYGSRTLNKAEQHYCTRRREMLAIVTFVKLFRSYLYGRKVLIRTDHASLKYLRQMKDPADQFARWIERLEETEYEIEIRKGELHSNADGLSRLCGGKKCICIGVARMEDSVDNTPDKVHASMDTDGTRDVAANEPPPAPVTPTDMPEAHASDPEPEPPDIWPQCKALINVVQHLNRFRRQPVKLMTEQQARIQAITFGRLWDRESMSIAQMEDPDISLIYMAKMDGMERPHWNDIGGESEALKALWAEWQRLELHNNNLYRRWESNDGSECHLQVVMPKCFQTMLLEQFHDTETAAHMGRRRALRQIQRRAFWYKMAEDVKLYIQSCEVCQRRKRPGKTPRAPMRVFTSGVVNERVSLDIAGPLVVTERKNKYILVITDQYTKYVRVFPLTNKTTKQVAGVFHVGWVCLFGSPRQVHTDQGKEFDSSLFYQLCALFHSEKTRTTAYHPQSDGQVERYNRTMWDLLHALVEEDPTRWDENLPYAARAYNATRHSTTGIEPNMLMFGRHAYMPYDVLTPEMPDEVAMPQNKYVLSVRRRMRKVHQIARQHLGNAATASRKYNDRRSNLVHYKTGDPVLLKVCKKTPRIGKMLDKYTGPYYVVDVLSDSSLRIIESPGSRPTVVHHDRLKPYIPRKPEEADTSWVYDLAKKHSTTLGINAGTQTEVDAVQPVARMRRTDAVAAPGSTTPLARGDAVTRSTQSLRTEPFATPETLARGDRVIRPTPLGHKKAVKVTTPVEEDVLQIRGRLGRPRKAVITVVRGTQTPQ